jgi:hypothetical protein
VLGSGGTTFVRCSIGGLQCEALPLQFLAAQILSLRLAEIDHASRFLTILNAGIFHKIHNIMPNIRGVWRLSSIEGFKLQKYIPNRYIQHIWVGRWYLDMA